MVLRDSKSALPLVLAFALASGGCAARSAHDRGYVSQEVQERTGHAAGMGQPGTVELPPNVSLQDGLSEDEAVAIALWNNPSFLADLATLGIARADLTDSGFLRNPVFSLLFPLGPKQLESTISWPIDQLWLRPRRVKIAQKEIERVAESLVQQGLNLTRDVQVTHANARLAAQRRMLVEQHATLATEIAAITRARLAAGDISELEANREQLEAERVRDEAARAVREVAVTHERLRALLGWSEAGTPFEVSGSVRDVDTFRSQEVLVKDALAARPDVRAAELAVEAAGARAKLEKSKVFALTAILDMNAEGKKGFEAGPGISGEIPLANLNTGGRARANAELEVAARRYTAARERAANEVRESLTIHAAARVSAVRWREQIVPRVREQAALTQKAYAAGDVSYLAWLATQRTVAEANLRAIEAEGEEARARAEVERSVGRRIAKK